VGTGIWMPHVLFFYQYKNLYLGPHNPKPHLIKLLKQDNVRVEAEIENTTKKIVLSYFICIEISTLVLN